MLNALSYAVSSNCSMCAYFELVVYNIGLIHMEDNQQWPTTTYVACINGLHYPKRVLCCDNERFWFTTMTRVPLYWTVRYHSGESARIQGSLESVKCLEPQTPLFMDEGVWKYLSWSSNPGQIWATKYKLPTYKRFLAIGFPWYGDLDRLPMDLQIGEPLSGPLWGRWTSHVRYRCIYVVSHLHPPLFLAV